jgi:hypothetical protein
MEHPKMVTPYLITEPLTSTRHNGRYRTVSPQRALYSVGVWPLHTDVINLRPFRFLNGYDSAVSEVKRPVSEVKPPPEFRSGQNVR